MTSSRGRTALVLSVLFLLVFVVLLGTSLRASAAPQVELVMDARTGKVLYSQNPDTRVHPASLTKMMTLYITFQAIENGEIGLDTKVTVSKNAASEPPSKLGLQPGQKVELRYLIRAAAVKSANDAATAIGEAIGGSEAGFARRMNQTAKSLGMTRSTFRNANGLTEEGHMSTARDMSILGRHLFYDYPQYYNLFSRRSTDVGGGKTVLNTNRKFLDSYPGADGIKTGYTSAAGSNLVASAQHGQERIITTVMGASSSAARNARVAELMDLGFRKAPNNARVTMPGRPVYSAPDSVPVAQVAPVTAEAVAALVADAPAAAVPAKAPAPEPAKTAAATARAVASSLRPVGRPVQGQTANVRVAALQAGVEAAVAIASTAPVTAAVSPLAPVAAAATPLVASAAPTSGTPRPAPRSAGSNAPAAAPAAVVQAEAPAATTTARPAETVAVTRQATEPAAVRVASAAPAPAAKTQRRIEFATTEPAAAATAATPGQAPVVVSRASTSGGRQWGINVGRYNSQTKAERVLLQTALQEIGTLDGALRKIQRGKAGYDANFVGLSADQAELACKRIVASGAECTTFGPSGS